MDEEAENYKTSTRKFMKLFNMPKEEKLVNRKALFVTFPFNFSMYINKVDYDTVISYDKLT